jgi:hypothetical protein
MASVHYNILTGAVTALQALNLTGITTNVKARKRISYFKGYDNLPMIQVVPGGAKSVAKLVMPDVVWYTYPILVALIVESGYTAENLLSHLEFYEAIETKLFYTGATGVSNIVGVSYNPNPSWDVGLLPEGFDVSLQMFTYTMSQTRRIA